MENPERFMKSFAASSGPAVRRWAPAKARPRPEPRLRRHGLSWEDLLPILETLDCLEAIQKAAEDPE